MSAISNTFNIIVFFKLLADAKIAKISSAEHLNRQRRNRRMLFQSCCQDCIAAIDTFNTTYAWRFYSSLWFKFLVCAYSRVLARTLEGVVMVTINETIRDSIHKRIFNGAKKRNSSTPAGSITIMSHSKTIIAANRFQNLRLNH
uniref:7TM_GPCR_Srx domain-containing protein n=1 Tax=Caenorhabditis japonica TaxID=281687 RepID=A0A8R1DI68_CAEJA